jgi:hypothetical protein
MPASENAGNKFCQKSTDAVRQRRSLAAGRMSHIGL